MQKKVYVLGALLGNGIRQGVGINAKGGKLKIMDIVTQGISGFIQQFFDKNQNNQAEENPVNQNQPPANQSNDVYKKLGITKPS